MALEGMAVLGARAGKAELTALMAGQKPGARPLAEEHKREVCVCMCVCGGGLQGCEGGTRMHNCEQARGTWQCG